MFNSSSIHQNVINVTFIKAVMKIYITRHESKFDNYIKAIYDYFYNNK